MSLRKLLGYTLILLSSVAWAALPVIPFLPLPGSEKVAWAGTVFAFAEVTWWVAMPLLGPEVMEWMRRLWVYLKQNLPGDKEESEEG